MAWGNGVPNCGGYAVGPVSSQGGILAARVLCTLAVIAIGFPASLLLLHRFIAGETGVHRWLVLALIAAGVVLFALSVVRLQWGTIVGTIARYRRCADCNYRWDAGDYAA